MMRILMVLATVLLMASSARASELRLVAAELPPFSYHVPPPTVSEIGEPRGIVYQLVREMAQRIGHSGTIEFMGWTRAQALAQTGLRNSGAEALLRASGFTRVEPASEEWVNALKLRDRRIDAWLAPRLMVLFGWREIGGDATTLNIGQLVRRSPIYFAASRDVSEAETERWRSAFAQVRGDGTFDRILAGYRRMKVEPIPEETRHFERIEWGY